VNLKEIGTQKTSNGNPEIEQFPPIRMDFTALNQAPIDGYKQPWPTLMASNPLHQTNSLRDHRTLVNARPIG